jgi:hypothetical protein
VDKLVVEMGERLREAVAAYQAVEYVTRIDPKWQQDPSHAKAWLARIERQVRLAFFLQAVEPHKGELNSTLIEQMAEECNEFIEKMKEGEALRVVEEAKA